MGRCGLDQACRSISAAGITADKGRRFYRTIWISDLHLGTSRCRARELLQFIDLHIAENLYLVGDIVDGWVAVPTWHWDRNQGAVVQKLNQLHRSGVRVVFLPGNHDELSIDLAQALLGPLPIMRELIHNTADGRRMLVTHGHQFDGLLNPNRWMYRLGASAYQRALRIDGWYSEEQAQGQDISARSYVKRRLTRAVRYLTDFTDRAVLDAARHHRADGVICGHTHLAEQRPIGPIIYINDGDWVKSCTALVEEHDGRLRLLHHHGGDGEWGEITAVVGEVDDEYERRSGAQS